MQSRARVPLIRQLRDSAEEARMHELDRAVKALARGEDPQQVLEQLSHGLTNKLMPGPPQALHQSGDDADAVSKTIARLYRLNDRDTRG